MVCSLSVKVIEERCSHVANILGYPSLKNEQKTVLANFVLGNGVFAMLPTGFGRSLCYACLPCLFDRLLGITNSIVVVITPLTSIMKEQVGYIIMLLSNDEK